MKYLLEISFLGTEYAGYQVQKNAPTVQGALCACFDGIFGEGCRVTGCSRTDSGVHARSFFCTLEIPEGVQRIPAEALPYAANNALPSDISVITCKDVPDSFHARYDVKYKEYEYIIFNGKQRSPFFEGRALHYPHKLDAELMNKAAAVFCGTHDFKAFMAQGSDISDTVRTVYCCSAERDGELVRIRISADGFLYNMVRIIVGTLIYVSEGKIAADGIGEIIVSKDRMRAGFTAPPYGLYLNRVVY